MIRPSQETDDIREFPSEFAISRSKILSGDGACSVADSGEPLAMRNLTDDQEERLGSLLEQYMTGLETGMPPSVDLLTRPCPELRKALQACVGGLENLHRMAGGEDSVDVVEPEAAIADSRQLGDFKLHEEIGRGGMGVVYRATQISLRRTVAIKLLPLTSVLYSRHLTRFQQEAEAAASLQHPNIVPVFAVGCQRGIHFYAMQFICGKSLDEVPKKARSWRVAVIQASQVADGLHAAHELGIIHRDIKPSNLIIDQNGKPWITDFGLARIQSDVSLTQSGDVIGTMRYMSPEQARGDSAIVDGRTDVYSLGATLYELLTGTPARDGEDAPSILRQIDEQSVAPLRKCCPVLPRDLETVVAKAMAFRRDERYETAKDFADDLRRVLSGQPTIARPPTMLDLGVRLATKYSGAVATVAVVGALALAGFAVSNTRLAAEKVVSDQNAALAQRNASLAQHNALVAREAVDRLGTQMAELLRDIPAANLVRHRLLSETLDYYQQLAKESASLDLRDREQQLDLAITHGKIGSFQNELGLNVDALRSLEKSEVLFARLASQFPADTELQMQWSISQNNLAETLAGSGNFDSATKWFAKAIRIQNQLHSQSKVLAAAELATTLNNLGRMLTESENDSEAETVFQRAIQLLRAAPADDNLRITIESNLAGLLVKQDAPRAISIARQSLAAQFQRLEVNPGDAKTATQVVLTLNTMASAQAKQSLHREAIESLRQAIEISGQLRSRWPEQVSYRRDLGISLNQLGLSLSAIGRMDKAAGAFERASKHARALLNVYKDDAQLHSMLGSTLNNLAFLKQRIGDQVAAESLYDEAIEHQSAAVKLAPQVPRYRVYLSKHEHNLQILRGES